MHIRYSLILALVLSCAAQPVHAKAGAWLRLSVKLESRHTQGLLDTIFEKTARHDAQKYSIEPSSPSYVYGGPSIDLDYDLSDRVSLGCQYVHPHKEKDKGWFHRRSYMAAVVKFRF